MFIRFLKTQLILCWCSQSMLKREKGIYDFFSSKFHGRGGIWWFWRKSSRGNTFPMFYWIFISKFIENVIWGLFLYHTPLSPSLCVHLRSTVENSRQVFCEVWCLFQTYTYLGYKFCSGSGLGLNRLKF